jgi:PEP-CTERM motif
MRYIKSLLLVLCIASVSAGTWSTTRAAFVDPSITPSGAAGFTNWTRADTDTTYQQWRGPANGGSPAVNGGGENFTSLFGLNQPDNDLFNPNGNATAQFLDASRNSTGFNSGVLTGGPKNIYSFFTSADWELKSPDYGYGSGATTTLILQMDIDGNEILIGPNTPNNPAAPNSVKVDGYDWVDHVELSRTASNNGGFPTAAVTHWFRFELPSNEAEHMLEFDTYDPSFGGYIPSIVDPLSTHDLQYGHTSIFAIAIDTKTEVSNLVGDLDHDGFVGITDLNIVLGNWNLNTPPGDTAADPSGDGFVGIEDLNVVLGNWNAGTPPNDLTIPEPSVLVMLGMGAAVFVRARR